MAVQRLLLQLVLEFADVLVLLVVGVRVLMVLQLELLDAPHRPRHLLPQLSDHLVRLGTQELVR